METRTWNFVYYRQERVIFKSHNVEFNMRAGARHAATAEETPPSKQDM